MTLHDNNKRCFHQRTNVLDGLHSAVGCQGLGNLLSCFWTEVVVPKTAETGEKMRRLANMKSLLSYALHDNNELNFLQRTNVLDVPHAGVGCQGLGNLLSTFWTEIVVPKTAETREMRRSAK